VSAAEPVRAAPRPPTRSRTPPATHAIARVFGLSLGEMLWSRRTIFMALVVGLPIVIGAIVRVLDVLGAPRTVGDVTLQGPAIFGLMIWAFFVRFVVPVLGVFYGTSLIADEVEEKTITYLFVRPIPRSAVLFGKYAAYLVCTSFVVLPSVMVVWLLVAPVGSGSLGATFPDLLRDLGLLAIGLAVYGAVFALIGTALRRPLLAGLLFVFGWEMFVLFLPGYLKRFSVAFHLQGLVPHAMPADSTLDLLQTLVREVPSLTESLIWLAAIEVGCLWLAARVVSTREYVLEQ
jgi:hypothetical protein